jgi:hypothetical protein
MGITREEKLLNSIANGVYSGVQPVTREEQYLSYIAGESYAKPEKPITRKELYLDKIPQGGSGGGGVTIRNQNKTITANGTYTADSGYTGLGIVEVNVQASGGANKLAQMVDGTLTEITAEDLQGATNIKKNAFYGNTSLQIIALPEGVENINETAFRGCTSLVSINFPISLKRIFLNAFAGCIAIEEITIPQNVIVIDQGAFSSCRNLKSVTMKPQTPPTLYNASAFQNVPTTCVFTVPVGSGDAYKRATNWSKYADQIVEGDV